MTMTTKPEPTTTQLQQPTPIENSLTAGRLPKTAPWIILGTAIAVSAGVFGVMALASGAGYDWGGAIFVGALLYIPAIWLFSLLVEGRRRAMDRLVTALVTGAFVLAMIPLISLTITVITFGLNRFDAEFFTNSMRNVTGEGGGVLHAIVGTLLMTGTAAIISIPIGLMTSIYLVEYGRGRLARGITFLVDVMTGIPSIVAREFLVSGLRLAALERGVVMRARDLGKLKTWSQATAAAVGGFAAAGAWSKDVAWWALLIAVALTWLSGLDYARLAPGLLSGRTASP